MKRKLRILVADDHDVVRSGVRAMVEARGWEVCGEARNGNEAVTLAARLSPDVAVVDMEMGGLDGLTVARTLKQQQPRTEIVLFTMHDDDYLIREAFAAGARSFVLKSEGGRKLVEAIQSASEHRPYFAARASETLVQGLLKSRKDTKEPLLTRRERSIVQLLAGGNSNKEVAVTLGISVKTVETHRARIMRKLGITSIVKLVRFAVRENLIKA
jgi:DNA-binding NarL/FixJ family response regulator